MSVVTLQLGQCGNQVGGAFFDCLAKEHVRFEPRESYGTGGSAHSSLFPASAVLENMFFRTPEQEHSSIDRSASIFKATSSKQTPRLVPRAVLIDLEPRVVQNLLSSKRSSSTTSTGSSAQKTYFRYDPSQAFYQQSGAGNNWLHGFKQGNLMEEQLESLIQREVDFVEDRLEAFLVFVSVAGGTGSGLGSFVMSLLKDLYPEVPILACCILPFQEGEVAVQSYNACLALHAAYEFADLIFPFENQRTKEEKKVLSTSVAQRRMNKFYNEFAEMNYLIVNTLLHSALLPVAVSKVVCSNDEVLVSRRSNWSTTAARSDARLKKPGVSSTSSRREGAASTNNRRSLSPKKVRELFASQGGGGGSSGHDRFLKERIIAGSKSSSSSLSTATSTTGSLQKSRICDLLLTHGSHPSYRFCTLRHLPTPQNLQNLFDGNRIANAWTNTDSWSALAKRIAHITNAKTVEDFYARMSDSGKNRLISCEAVCRRGTDNFSSGASAASTSTQQQQQNTVQEVAQILAAELEFSTHVSCVSRTDGWGSCSSSSSYNFSPRATATFSANNCLRVVESYTPPAPRGLSNSVRHGAPAGGSASSSNTVSLATNCQTVLRPLEQYLQKATSLARSACYRHYFDEELLTNAILGVQQICEDYRQLSGSGRRGTMKTQNF
ncbi:unnamed protein product, partial [Amoebophrya sp. A120]|eukprot:GSA120T00019209001.1